MKNIFRYLFIGVICGMFFGVNISEARISKTDTVENFKSQQEELGFSILREADSGSESAFIPSSEFADLIDGLSSGIRSESGKDYPICSNLWGPNCKGHADKPHCDVIGKYKNKAGKVYDRGGCLSTTIHCQLPGNSNKEECSVEGGDGNAPEFGGGNSKGNGTNYGRPEDLNISGLGSLAEIKNVNELVGYVLNYALSFLTFSAVAVLIYAGFLYLTSGINEDNIAKSKQMIVGSVAGILLALSSWTIVNTIINLDIPKEERAGRKVFVYYKFGNGRMCVNRIQENVQNHPLIDDNDNCVIKGAEATYSAGTLMFSCPHQMNLIKKETKTVFVKEAGVEVKTKCSIKKGLQDIGHGLGAEDIWISFGL
jgi:hypothetical protein